MGLWEELLQEYTHELVITQSSGEGVLAVDLSRLPPQAQEEDATKMARKIGGGGFKAAKSLLEGKLAAPPMAATNDEIVNLAAIDIDAEERAQTKLQCAHIGGAVMKNMAASVGPSQLTKPRRGGCNEVAGKTQTARELGGPLVAWLSV